MDLTKLIIEELKMLKLNLNDFNIFGVGQGYYYLMPCPKNYCCYYIVDRAYKQFYKEFENLNDAKKYLVDLYQMAEGKPFIFRDLEDDVFFDFEKKQILKLIDQKIDKNRGDTVLKKSRVLISKIQRLSSKQSFREIDSLLSQYGFSFGQKIIDEVSFFTYMRDV
mgnify:FL=1